MPQEKTLGFFDFHITADKANDYLLRNGFDAKKLMITSVKIGEKFGEVIKKVNEQPEKKEVAKELDHPTIISFFKHLFHFEGKEINSNLPYIADRNGYILTVLTDNPEEKEIATESLDSLGAYFIKEM
jgi:hypothetical protein